MACSDLELLKQALLELTNLREEHAGIAALESQRKIHLRLIQQAKTQLEQKRKQAAKLESELTALEQIKFYERRLKELRAAGKDVWVIVNGPEDASVSYEQPSGDVAEPEATPEATPAPTEAPAEAEGGSSATVWIIVAVAVVAVVVIAVVVSKKKKKD